MHSLRNHNNSCFLDTLLVVMFSKSVAFDFIFQSVAPTQLVLLLAKEVYRIRTPSLNGWVCSEFRNAMGAPWNAGTTQSSVDLLHAILDKVNIPYLGSTITTIQYIAHENTTKQIGPEGCRIHLAVAGEHNALSDVFRTRVDVLPSDAESFATNTTVRPVGSPHVLVIEVGRNDSVADVAYGTSASDHTQMITCEFANIVYKLLGVVCRVNNHYVGWVFCADSGWMFYNDLATGNELTNSTHPEMNNIARPSRYGELFFYELLGET